MKWLILLVASVVTVSGVALKEGTEELVERILKTEQECNDLRLLKERHGTPYTDLLPICEESLNQDKYAYIDINSVDLGQYSGDAFPVPTGHGETLVKKPPLLSSEGVQEKIKDFGDKKITLAKRASKLAQEIVDQQVKCALAGSKDDDGCTQYLNCKKDKFLADEKLNLNQHRDSFPITYKGKGTKINSPPDAVRGCEATAETADVGSRDNQQSGGDAATPDKDSQGSANEDDTDFEELEGLESEAPRRKAKGTSKMVTKGMFDDFAKELVTSAVSKGMNSNTNGEMANGGNNLNPNPAKGKVKTPKSAKTATKPGVTAALSSLRREHIDSIVKVATNRLKAKENRDKVNRDDLRAAIEIFSKTIMHFILVSAKVASNMASKDVTPDSPFWANLKIALMDTAAAFLVNFIIDKLIPQDEFLPKNNSMAPSAYNTQLSVSNNQVAPQEKSNNPKSGFIKQLLS